MSRTPSKDAQFASLNPDIKEEVVAGRTYLIYDPLPSQLAAERQRTIEELAKERAAQVLQEQASDEPRICTSEAVDRFFEIKADLRLKASTEQTNRKRLKPFAAEFEFIPLDGDTIRKRYLSCFDKLSPRYQRNIYDMLTDFYKTIIPKYHLPLNPMTEIRRPQLNGNGATQPHPLNSKWLPKLMRVAETETEVVSLHTELGAGWRPVEFMRIKAIDVREALYREHPLILVHGKERDELTPLLPETLELLRRLTPSNLGDHELIIRSRRVRSGVPQPMGAKAHTTLIYGLYQRADIPAGFIPYDLRDTFASMVYEASGDWWLMERLMRHVLEGEGKKYARYPFDKLCPDLERFSPLRQIQQGAHYHEPPVHVNNRQGGVKLSGEGGTRTPMHCCTRS